MKYCALTVGSLALAASAQALSIRGWKPLEKPLEPVKKTAEAVQQVVTKPAETVQKIAENPLEAIPATIVPILAPGVPGATAVAEAAANLADQVVVKPANELVRNAGEQLRRDVDNVSNQLRRDVSNAGDAFKASWTFVERQTSGFFDSLADAEKRVRDGKFIDAAWHLSTDHYRKSEENYARAFQESSVLRTGAAILASFYGGPGGGAAFQSWYTYRASNGDIELSLKTGAIAWASGEAAQYVGKLPGDGVADAALRVGGSGAVAAGAAAASGGDANAVRDAFILGAGSATVQEGYAAYNKTKLDARPSEGPSYNLSPYDEVTNPNGVPEYAIYYDANGNRAANVRLLDPHRPHMGIKVPLDKASSFGAETTPTMQGLSKFPMNNAASVWHDNFCMDLRLGTTLTVATIPPIFVATYYASPAPLQNFLTDVSLDNKKAEER